LKAGIEEVSGSRTAQPAVAEGGGQGGQNECSRLPRKCTTGCTPVEALAEKAGPRRHITEPTGGVEHKKVVQQLKEMAVACREPPPDSLVVRRARRSRSQPTQASTWIKDWTLGEQLGKGAYGCAIKARENRCGGTFAVKRVPTDDAASLKQLRNEIDICEGLQHANIVSFLGSEEIGGYLYMFMEFMACGSMDQQLKHYGALKGFLLHRATKESLAGLNYLHSRSPAIIHRDIKSANLLVDADFHVKLSDFGCSRLLQSSCRRAYSTQGTVKWMAPEVMTAEGHGLSADIWSFGCTVLEFATAEKPWENQGFKEPLAAIYFISKNPSALPDIPESVPKWCRKLIKHCVRRNESERPTTEQLLEDIPLEATPLA